MRYLTPGTAGSLALLAGCGSAFYSVESTSGADCHDVDDPSYGTSAWRRCPVALGAELHAYATVDTDVSEIVAIEDVALRPADLATIELADRPGGFIVRPLRTGIGSLEVTLAGGTLIPEPLRVEEVASTTITVIGAPTGDFALLAGSAIPVSVDRRDAANEYLLGSGLDTWTVTGGDLVEETRADPFFDDGVGRTIRAAGPDHVVISTGAATLALDVVPLGSTRTLAVAGVVGGTLAAGVGWHGVHAFDAQQRELLGGPAITATSSDPKVVKVQVAGHSLYFDTYRAGSSQVTVTFDGVTTQFIATVD